jgi:hypothetical protein
MVFILKISFMKKDLFKINEEERNRILEMHITATKNKYLFEDNTTTTTTTVAATPTTPTPAPTTPTAARYTTATCAGKKPNCQEKVLKIQIRMNDECPAEVLTTKLVEDGAWGIKSSTAWGACKGKLKPTKQAPTTTTDQKPAIDNTTSQETMNQMFNS